MFHFKNNILIQLSYLMFLGVQFFSTFSPSLEDHFYIFLIVPYGRGNTWDNCLLIFAFLFLFSRFIFILCLFFFFGS